MSSKESSSKVSAVLHAPWVRGGVAVLTVAAGLIAAGSGVSAWAERPAADSQAASDAARGDQAHRHGPRGADFHRVMHRPGGPEGGGLLLGGPRLDRMLDEVKATDAQRQQIRTIADAARADVDKLRESSQQLRQQSLNLLVQPKVDAVAAEALRQKMEAQHAAISKRLLVATLDSANVLTPEQRAQLGEHLKERQAKREQWQEKHREQRERVGGPKS